MKNSQLIIDLEKTYNATFIDSSRRFASSVIQAEAFGRILDEFVLRPMDNNLCAFSVKNEGGSWATFICDETVNGCLLDKYEKTNRGKVTILLHWGMNYNFLDDLTSWGHERCPYKVEDVDGDIVDFFKKEDESNYWSLYDAAVRFKETGVWKVEE